MNSSFEAAVESSQSFLASGANLHPRDLGVKSEKQIRWWDRGWNEFLQLCFYVVCVGLPCLGSNSKTFPVRVSQAFSFFLSLYFQLDIEKMIHVQNPLQLVKIFKITDSLAPPTHPTTPNQPTTKQQSYHLRQRM